MTVSPRVLYGCADGNHGDSLTVAVGVVPVLPAARPRGGVADVVIMERHSPACVIIMFFPLFHF